MTPRPPVVQPGGELWRPGEDNSRYLIPPSWFEHPSISIPGGATFIWPLQVEGFRLVGNAQLGIHRYLGDDEAVVEVTHRSESRIEMSGVFPGKTGVANMRELRDICVAKTPKDGKILRLPGIFPNEQYVVVENWDFSHSEEERTEEILYNITFVKTGIGKRVQRKTPKYPSPNPKRVRNKGKSSRVFTIRAGVRTLRGVANKVYGNHNRWREIYNLNVMTLNHLGIPFHQMPTKQLPIGLGLRY